MSVLRAKLPDTIMNVVKAGLGSFIDAEDPSLDMLRSAASGAVGERLGVYTLETPALVSGGVGLAAAQFRGWRIMAGADDLAVAADVYTMERKGPVPMREGEPRLACIRKGPHIGNILEAVKMATIAAAADTQTNAPFTLHLLLMHPIYTEALYLESTVPSAAHRLFPYYTLIKSLSIMAFYTETAFIDTVRPVILEKASFDHAAIIKREKAATKAQLGL